MFISYKCVFEPFNYKQIYISNPEKVIEVKDSSNDEYLTCERIALLQELEEKGLLLTPQEYTSHISSYYSTLVAFLIGLFVLFTIGSIYSIKVTSKKEIDEAKKDLDDREKNIKENLKKEIKENLSELLRDSISFKETVVSAIYGRVEDDLITKEDKDIVDKRIDKLEEDIILLYESLDTKNEAKGEQADADQEIE